MTHRIVQMYSSSFCSYPISFEVDIKFEVILQIDSVIRFHGRQSVWYQPSMGMPLRWFACHCPGDFFHPNFSPSMTPTSDDRGLHRYLLPDTLWTRVMQRTIGTMLSRKRHGSSIMLILLIYGRSMSQSRSFYFLMVKAEPPLTTSITHKNSDPKSLTKASSLK